MIRLAICEENNYLLCVQAGLLQYGAHVIHSIVRARGSACFQAVYCRFHCLRSLSSHNCKAV